LSELIAEARVLVFPDTTGFRAALITQTTKAAAGVTVAVGVTPVFAGAGTAAATAAATQLAAATNLSSDAIRQASDLNRQGAVDLSAYKAGLLDTSKAEEGAIASKKALGAQTRKTTQQIAGAERGAAAAALSMTGLRGATLAATGPFLAGAVAVGAFGAAVNQFAQFEEQLNVFQASANASANEMTRVAEVAKQLGQDIRLPGVSAGDAAEAMTEFSKAGLSVNDSIAATPGALQLATAAQLGYAEATNLTASALNAFGLSGDQAVHVADVLANASNEAQGGIAETALALRQAASAAAVVGVTFEDTAALLTILAKSGLTGSDAGTALRTAFLRLVNPSKEAQKIIAKLGVDLRDLNGNVRPDVFAQFAAAQSNLARSTQQANAAIVFGQDAFRAIGILGPAGAAGLEQVRIALDREGAAAELAAARSKGLAGESRALKSNLETLGVTIGQGVNPFLAGFARGLNQVATAANIGFGAFGKFVSGLGEADFDSANADLGELLDQLVKLQEQTRTGPGEFEFSTENIAPELQEIADLVALLGEEFSDTPAGVEKFVNAFTAASPLVKKAMQDDVITPLENAQLSAFALGRAFLAGLPRSAFAGLGAAARSGIEDATARAKTAVEDMGAEIRSGIEDAAREGVSGHPESTGGRGAGHRPSIGFGRRVR
jgi:TP901 family phage tail tape measure protein